MYAKVNGRLPSAPLAGGYFPGENPATINVSYSGDSVYGPGSMNVSLNVTQNDLPPFSLSGTSLTFPAGATTGNVSTITVTPENGFTGTVYFSCALTSNPAGAVHLPTCSITPSENVTGASPVAPTMTVSSTAPTTVTTTTALQLPSMEHWAATYGGFLLAGFLLVGVPRCRHRQRLALFGLVFLLGSFLACGGGSHTVVTQVPGTTPGSYTFTVNAAFAAVGVPQAQTTVAVTIQ
jgi:hypothetical protein